MTSRLGFVVLTSASVLAFAANTFAAPVFSLVSDRSNYVVTPGGSAAVNVFLKETFSASDVDQIMSENGLIGYDLNLSTTAGTGRVLSANTNPSSFSSVFATQVSPSPIPTGGTASVDAVLLSNDSPGPIGTLAGNTRSILLSSFLVSGGASAGSQTSFVLQDSTLYGTNTITDSGSSLDALIQQGSFTVNVVSPEPAALGVLSPLAIFLLRKRRTRV